MNGNKMDKRHREEVAMVPKAGWGEKTDGWEGDNDGGAEEEICGVGSCRPQPLKLFSGMKTFTLFFGLSAMFVGALRGYLSSQLIWLERLYDITPKQGGMLVSCVDIPFLVIILFISVFARRWHIPRTLSITTAIVAIAALLCVIPYATHKSDLTPPPNVTEETKFTMEKLLFQAPTCTVNPAMKEEMMKMLMSGGDSDCDEGGSAAAATGGNGASASGPSKTNTNPGAVVSSGGGGPAYTAPADSNAGTPVKGTDSNAAEDNTRADNNAEEDNNAGGDNNVGGDQPSPSDAVPDSAGSPGSSQPVVEEGGSDNPGPTQPPTVKEEENKPPVQTMTVEIPDFKKLSTNEKYPMLKNMAMQLHKINLDDFVNMDTPTLIEALKNMPPEAQKTMPQLKIFLGPKADEYFKTVTIPVSRRKRQATEGAEKDTQADATVEPSAKNKMLEDLKMDDMWTGKLAWIVRTSFAEIFNNKCTEKKIRSLVSSMCPFNTGPFLEDTEGSAAFMVAFVALGMVLVGVARAAHPAFLAIYVDNRTSEMRTGVYLGIIFGFGTLSALVAQIFGGVASTNYITMEDVGIMSYLNPRWLGAWWLGFVIIGVACFILAIPVFFFPNPRDRQSRSASSKGVSKVIKGFFQSGMRLLGNPIFLLITLGNAVTLMAVQGMLEFLPKYVEKEFSFGPMKEGVFIGLIIALVIAVGVVVGGIISTCAKLSPFSCLKMVVGCALVMVVLQAATLGMGCDQPVVNKGEMTVNDTITQQPIQCSKTCVCIDFLYMPVCGSDGVSYFSPCHAGCGHPQDGEWHHCRCIPDEKRTAKPGLCQQECQGGMFIGYSIVMGLACFLMAVKCVPAFLATYRSVERSDAPMAIGVNAFLATLIGVIPSHMIYDAMFDGICLLERSACGPVDTCAIYDTQALRMRFNGLGTGLKALAAILYLVAMVLGFRGSSVFGRAIHKADRRK